MPTIQHNVLTGSELHEPKGISSANEGGIYVADGAGSGDWQVLPSGWGMYADDATEQTFNTTAAKISIDGAGAVTEESYLPLSIRGSGSLWDTTNDKITPVAVGDSYTARLDLPVTSRATAQYATLQLDIGGGATPSSVILSQRIDTNRSAPFNLSVTFSFFSLSTFLTNGGQLFLTTDAGSIGVTAPRLLLTRDHGEMT